MKVRARVREGRRARVRDAVCRRSPHPLVTLALGEREGEG